MRKSLNVLLILALLISMLVSIPAMAEDEPAELTVLYTCTTTNWEGNAVFDALQAGANVKLNVEIAPSTSYTDRLRLLLMSGETLPDVVYFTNQSDLYLECIQNKTLIPLDEYYEATTYLKDFQYKRNTDALRVNGELYAVPRESWFRADGMMLREDWMTNLGITVEGDTITLEQFEDILYQFTYGDPDGDGENNTYGFAKPSNTNWNTAVPPIVLNAFGTGMGLMIEDGKIVDTDLTTNWEQTAQAIQWVAEQYEKGVVDPEIFTIANEAFRSALYSGHVGMTTSFGSSQSYVNFIAGIRNITPTAELVWINAIEGPAGTTTRYVGGTTMNGWFGITSACKDPEAAMRYFDFLASPEGQLLIGGGIEGTHYSMVDGKVVRNEEQAAVYAQEQRAYSYDLLWIRNPRDPDWYFDFPNMDPHDGERVTRYVKSSLNFEFNDDMGLKDNSLDVSVLDQLTELSDAFTLAVNKYIRGDIDFAEVEAAHDAYVNSDAFATKYESLTKVYENAGFIK